MCPTPGISTISARGISSASLREFPTGTIMSSDPCTIKTRAFDKRRASMMFSGLSASAVGEVAPRTARARLTPPVAAASTTRTIPASHPVTALGLLYPSAHVASMRMRARAAAPTALPSPSRQNDAERTSLRTANKTTGLAAKATTTRNARAHAPRSKDRGFFSFSFRVSGRSPTARADAAITAGATKTTSSMSPSAAAMAAATPPMLCPTTTRRARDFFFSFAVFVAEASSLDIS
mmetsp:Transcript_15428/g.65074  ORF Transcript_15428/g.65074 Transcript_15428/m.65074 type:complete len:236 (-) Transcript_15428:894-1601(-)